MGYLTRLTAEEIARALTGLPEWRLEGGEMVCDGTLVDFAAAMRFVNAVAVAAEEQNHHPDIDIRYNKVRLALVSHDAGGLTARDVRLATRISALGRD